MMMIMIMMNILTSASLLCFLFIYSSLSISISFLHYAHCILLPSHLCFRLYVTISFHWNLQPSLTITLIGIERMSTMLSEVNTTASSALLADGLTYNIYGQAMTGQGEGVRYEQYEMQRSDLH